jgi:hypothetical protein
MTTSTRFASGGIAMLTGTSGMFAGLALDARDGGIALLGAMCGPEGALGLIDAIYIHWIYFPYMHIGMIGGAATGVLIRHRPGHRRVLPLGPDLADSAACTALMIVGMSLGGGALRFAAPLFTQAGQTGALLSTMMLGMTAAWFTWTRVVHVHLRRLTTKT